MDDFRIYARPPPKQEGLWGRVTENISNLLGRKAYQLVGKSVIGEVFERSVGTGIIPANQEDFEKLIQDRTLVPIPIKDLKDIGDARSLKPDEVLFINIRMLNNLGISKFTINEIRRLLDNPKTKNNLKLTQVLYRIHSDISMKVSYQIIRETLVKKWSAPIQQDTVQRAEDFTQKHPSVQLNESQYQQLLDDRTGGSTTIREDSTARRDWLNADRFIRELAEIEEPLTVEILCDLNKVVNGEKKEEIIFGEKVVTEFGVLRDSSVMAGGIIGAKYPHEDDVIDLLNDALMDIQKGFEENENPIILASTAYQRLVSIHPFPDGNGRTCRLIMDYIFIRHGLPPPSLGKNITVAIFGDQRKINQDVNTPTSAVEKILEGLQKSYDILNI